MTVRVELAGRLGLTAGDRRIDATQLVRHDRLVLAYLTVERARHVSRDELAEVVWESRLTPTWKTALRGVVSRVRRVLATVDLPADSLVTGPGWYELSLPDDTIVDVEAAERGLAAAIELLAAARPAAARAAADSALEIARRPFLSGVDAAWVGHRQDRLDEIRLRAIEIIADAAMLDGDWTDARRRAEQALVLGPLRESAHRRLALAHAGCGDRDEALRVIARCRQAIADELGADISPETEALGVGLLRGAPLSTLTGTHRERPIPAPRSGATPAVLARLADRSIPFIGREDEAARLSEAWQGAMAGSPAVAVVAGEAGVGKSRLIAEFAAVTARHHGATVLYGRAEEAARAGPGALTEALRGHLRTGAINAEVVRATVARIGPAVLVMDDVQWLGREGLSILRYVLRCADPLPLLVAATFRTGEPAATVALSELLATLGRDGPVVSLELRGLPRPDVARLVAACTGRTPDPDTTATIADATAGNPLFVRELSSLWAERLVPVTETTVDEAPLGVPDGVRPVILARCRRLSAPTRRVLAAAAVCGRDIDLATLEAMPDLSTVDVLEGLEEALASHLVVEQAVPGRFAFVHGLVQETLYGELSAVRRQRLHADAATALEAGPSADGNGPPRVAYHLLRGGPDLEERATVAAARAGADALRRHAYDEAVRHYTAALAVAGPDPSVRSRLRLDLAGSRWRAGETATARADYDEAAAQAYQVDRYDLAARAVFGVTSQGPTLGQCDQREADQLAAALKGLDSRDPFRPRLMARLAAELAGVGDPRASDMSQEALELATDIDQSTVAYAINCLNWVNLGLPTDRNGLDRADRMIALGDAAHDRHMHLEGRLWRCTYLMRAGRIAEAEQEAALVERLAVALRQPFFLRLPLRLRASLAGLAGRSDEAAGLAAEAYAIERRVHAEDAEVHARLHAASLGYRDADWSELDAAEDDMDSPQGMTLRAVHLATRGQIAPAARLLRPLLADDAAVLGRGPLAAFCAAHIVRAGEADRRLGSRVDLEAAYALLLPWQGSHIVAGCAVASLGPVCAVGGESGKG